MNMCIPQSHMGVTATFFGFVVCALLFAASAQTRDECGTDIDSGDAAYARFENALALRCFSAAYRTCPGAYEATIKMTRALIDLGEDMNTAQSESLYARALLYADTLRAKYPDSAQPFFLTAVAAANIAQTKKGGRQVELARVVERNVKISILKDSTYAPAYVVLGALWRRVALSNPILKALGRIVYGWQSHATLHGSEESLRRAIALEPGSIYAHLELAKTLEAMGRRAEAVDTLDKTRTLPRTWHQDNELLAQCRELQSQMNRHLRPLQKNGR